ncbi:MAG: RagB/SusD family nutrient uptake outer membrane protein [Prevotellaceae bacterium]|jgi:hypothetical protein|nr:RagB/SusD family nutrient uptake outer membrane protein [Prevotellaceae bacterium]
MKKIKNILLSITGALALVMAASCADFLEEKPLDIKTDKQFWISKTDAESAVNMIYYGGVPYLYGGRGNGWEPTRLMYNGLLSGLFIDEKGNISFTSTDMKDLNITVQTVDEYIGEVYREPYVCIGRCNVLIARLPGMVEKGIISETEKNEYLAQAYFFRAWSYYFLVKEFGCKDGEPQGGGGGGVPLVLEPVESADPSVTNQPRALIADVYQRIESDLTEAIKYLPNKTFYNNDCRITKPAAQTLLATVYLQWAGYPLQNTAMYEKAAQTAEAVITGASTSGHGLEASANTYTGSAFNKIKTDKTSKEIIYAIEYNEPLNRGNGYINACMTTQAIAWQKKDGSNVFLMSVLENMYHADNAIINSYVTGDVRSMEKNFFFREYTSQEDSTYQCNQWDNWLWFEETAMIANKTSSLNFPVFRFSEVYLIAAEALLKQASPNAAKAKEYLEEVRKRAFTVNGGQHAGYSVPATVTIDDILTERLHEFPLEFKVWDDIRRTRLYPQVNSGVVTWQSITTATTYGKASGKSFRDNQHMLIWPIPQKAIDRNPALQQNPGY